MALGMIHLGAIGDLILAMPVAEAIADGEPIHLMGRGPHKELAIPWRACQHYADSETCGLHTLLAGEPSERMRRWLDQCGPKPPLLFAASQIAKLRWINTRDGDGRTHISLQMLRRQCPRVCDEDLPLPKLVAEPARETGGAVLLHPGSGGLAKCWPLHHFPRLAWHLRKAGFSIHWLLGPAEVDRYVDEQLHGEIGHIHRNLPLTDVLALLAGCSAYVGNDSGITHAAAALGRPTIALFGPTNPAVWAPRGKSVTALPFTTSAADVAAAVFRMSVET